MKITIIGIQDILPDFSTEVRELISSCANFAGGKRHHELVESFLPENCNWVDIVVPLSGLYDQMTEQSGHWIVFASGDPLFYGIGITLKRQFPVAEFNILPTFNSLQLLAHRLMLPYGEFQTVTLTGRPWHEFDKALIQGVSRMGILTDRKNTPATMAQRMIQFNYTNYKMYYGEHLGGEEERIEELTLEDALHLDFKHPNCFFLEKTNDDIPRKGIPEQDFETLPGRPNMITKMPIRLATLAFMELHNKKVMWDVGACSGSISIESKLHAPHLKIEAFEIRDECDGIIMRNAAQFQTPGINLHIGDYLEVEKDHIEAPDVVFLGGYGGKMEEVLDDINSRIADNGTIAFNSVKEESQKRFVAWCDQNQYNINRQHSLTVDDHNTMNIIVAGK